MATVIVSTLILWGAALLLAVALCRAAALGDVCQADRELPGPNPAVDLEQPGQVAIRSVITAQSCEAVSGHHCSLGRIYRECVQCGSQRYWVSAVDEQPVFTVGNELR